MNRPMASSAVEGYYEWQKTEDGKKIPNYLYSEQDELLGFAGLYEFWPDPSLPEDDPGTTPWATSMTGHLSSSRRRCSPTGWIRQ
jgi:putative SOS response-associated peptidase YedK